MGLDSEKPYCKSCHHNKYVAFELDEIHVICQRRGVPESARSISQAQLAAALECTLQWMRCSNVKKAAVESTSHLLHAEKSISMLVLLTTSLNKQK